jgi:hypothetical protein
MQGVDGEAVVEAAEREVAEQETFAIRLVLLTPYPTQTNPQKTIRGREAMGPSIILPIATQALPILEMTMDFRVFANVNLVCHSAINLSC